MSLDNATKMAVILARKGLDDETIGMVLSTLNQSKPSKEPTMATHGVNAPLFSVTGESAVVNPTVVTVKPRSTTKPPKRTRARKNGDAARWYPLLDSLRKIAATRGPLRGDIRSLAEMCPTELFEAQRAESGGASLHGLTTNGPMVRGLGGIVSRYAREGKPLRGMRFLLEGHEVVRSIGGAYAIYRVEAV